jgi:hypothetical protein
MEDPSGFDVTNVTISAVQPVTEAEAEQKRMDKNISEIAKNINDTIESFSDEVPVDDSTSNLPRNEKEAKKFLESFSDFIAGEKFKQCINEKAKKYHIPPKQLAKNFLTKSLGIVGDVLGIAVSTAGNIAHTLVSLISTVVHSGVDLVCKLASALSRIFTLNQTCTAR